MSIEAAVARVNNALNKASAFSDKIRERSENGMDPSELQRFAEAAAEDIAPLMRQMLISNYESSEVKTRTGKLLDAVENAAVWVVVRGGRAELRAGLKRGAEKKVYVYGNSLEYGSVRAPSKKMALIDLPTGAYKGFSKRSVLGQKIKRTIKKAVLSGKGVGKRVREYLENPSPVAVRRDGRELKRNKGVVDLENDVTVIKPKKYFQLSASQKETIAKEFLKALAKRIKSARDSEAFMGDNTKKNSA